MARFKRKARAIYARARSSFKRKSSRRSSGSSSGNMLMTVVAPAFVYGGVRETAKGFVSPVSSMLPFGNNNDEVVMGVAGWALHKYTSGFTKDLGRAMLTVEVASLGHNIVNPMLQGMTTPATQSSNVGLYNF